MSRKVVILGSGAAGLTAAIYTARADLKPLIIEGLQPGGQLTITTDVENFPGFEHGIMGPELMTQMRKQAERFGTEIIAGDVGSVDLKRRPFVLTVSGARVETETLIIATGASAKLLGLESERKLMGHGVSACATCDGFFFRNQHVVVVGGGDTAMEEATFLSKFASKVTILHRRHELRASKAMQKRAQENPKIAFIWNTIVDDIYDVNAGKVTGLRLRDAITGKLTDFACEGVFMGIGHKPNTELFQGQLELNDVGYIITKKSSMETNIPGVFAAGDVQDPIYRQAITAAGTGCMAAIDAERFLQHG